MEPDGLDTICTGDSRNIDSTISVNFKTLLENDEWYMDVTIKGDGESLLYHTHQLIEIYERENALYKQLKEWLLG